MLGTKKCSMANISSCCFQKNHKTSSSSIASDEFIQHELIKGMISLYIYMGVSKNRGTPKSSILIGFSIINHPFWGTIIFGNTHIYIYMFFFGASCP